MNLQSISLARPATPSSSRHAAGHHGGRGTLSFLGHFGGMVVAMMAGMAAFGMLLDVPRDSATELYVLLMAGSMSLPMVALMAWRRHSWRASAEMVAAMVVPPVALFPLLWAGVISGNMLVALQHGLMLPSMLAVMLVRRSEYGLPGRTPSRYEPGSA
jgi:hypothetical protein